MITKKALKASAAARQGKSQYLTVMLEGEIAARRGLPETSSPYADTEWREVWLEGWQDIMSGGGR